MSEQPEPEVDAGDMPELSLRDLKPIEHRILGYLVGGATTAEACEATGLSVHAMENHMGRLLKLLPPSRRHRGALVAYGHVMNVPIIPVSTSAGQSITDFRLFCEQG